MKYLSEKFQVFVERSADHDDIVHVNHNLWFKFWSRMVSSSRWNVVGAECNPKKV